MNAKVKILQVIDETPRAKLFRLEKPAGFSFEPGQFVSVSIEGLVEREGILAKRSYSIASAPHDTYIELCITKADKGFFSSAVHKLKVGDCLLINGPFGVFKLKVPVPDNVTFVAGGSGISPLRSMIRHLVFTGSMPKGSRLFYGFRSPEDFIYRDEVLQYAEERSIILHPTIDVPAASWKRDVGFVSDIIPKHSNYVKSDVYICGPPLMVSSAIKALVSAGFSESRIFREQW